MPKRFYKELGVLLKEERIRHSMSQQDVADRIKVSRGTVANWETGRRVIYIDDLFRLCDMFGIDPNELTDKVKRYLYKD